MPFCDEIGPVAVVAYRSGWPGEFRTLARQLLAVLPSRCVGVDHVGSTSVPGLASKDVIDVQIRAARLDDPALDILIDHLGYRERPEAWNRRERAQGREWPKRVFAPPVGARPVNVHVRPADAPTVRVALLFRDYLRADQTERRAWADFKQAAAQRLPNLADYGAVKAPAWTILMRRAERWAKRTGWHMSPPDVTPRASA